MRWMIFGSGRDDTEINRVGLVREQMIFKSERDDVDGR